MERHDRSKLIDLFFQIKEIIDRHPQIEPDLRQALRLHKITNSSAIETEYIDPIFLLTALYNSHREKQDFISPVYRKAYLETRSHDLMLRNLENQAAEKAELSVSLVLGMHRTIFEQSWPDIAGRFRDLDVRIKGSSHRPPHYLQLPELVYQHLVWLDGLLKLLGPVTKANFYEILHVSAEAHFRMLWTYPFRDGNVRVARGVANYILLYCGMPYNVITFEHRQDYLRAIEKSTLADFSPLEDFLNDCYAHTLGRVHRFVRLLESTIDV